MRQLLFHVRTILRHRDIVVLLGCNLLLGLAYSFVGPFFSLFALREVGMSPPTYAGFMTITSASAIVLSTILARWSDTRYSRRAILMAGCISGLLGYLAYAFVRDLVTLTLTGALFVGLSSVTFAQLFALGRDLVTRSDLPPKDAPLYMNIFRLVFAISWTVGPAIAAWVLARYSFRATFLVAAFFFLLLLVAVVVWLPATPPRRAAPGAAPLTPLREVLLRPDVVAHFISFTLVFAATTMGMSNLPLLVLDTLHGTPQDIGIVFSLGPVFEIPFMYYVGLLATRQDQARIIRGSIILAVVYYGLLAVVGAPWHIYPLQILGAAVTAVTQGIAITFFQNFLPDQVGTATNLYSSAHRIGMTAGYIAFGLLLPALGHRGIFALGAAICLVAFALLWFWRPRKHREPAIGNTIAA